MTEINEREHCKDHSDLCVRAKGAEGMTKRTQWMMGVFSTVFLAMFATSVTLAQRADDKAEMKTAEVQDRLEKSQAIAQQEMRVQVQKIQDSADTMKQMVYDMKGDIRVIRNELEKNNNN